MKADDIKKVVEKLRKNEALTTAIGDPTSPVLFSSGKAVGEIFGYSSLSFDEDEYEGRPYIAIYYDGELFGSAKSICSADAKQVEKNSSQNFYEAWEGMDFLDRAAELVSRTGKFRVSGTYTDKYGRTRYTFKHVG